MYTPVTLSSEYADLIPLPTKKKKDSSLELIAVPELVCDLSTSIKKQPWYIMFITGLISCVWHRAHSTV